MMVKNNRIDIRVSREAKEGLKQKAESCDMCISEFIEEIGKKPISFIEIVRQ